VAGGASPLPIQVYPGVSETAAAFERLAFIFSLLKECSRNDGGVAVHVNGEVSRTLARVWDLFMVYPSATVMTKSSASSKSTAWASLWSSAWFQEFSRAMMRDLSSAVAKVVSQRQANMQPSVEMLILLTGDLF
jgi:hypothetical protein